MRFRIRYILFFMGMLFTCKRGFGQDHLYSQFFNSPVYLNPALNGQFQGDFRVNMIYRNQFTTSGDNSNYLTASVDYNIPKFGGGVGLIFNRSSEGNAFLNKNNIAGIYSYSVGSDDYILSFGLQAGATNQSLDYSRLVFGDQIDPRFGIVSGTSAAEPLQFNNKYFFDAGFGLNFVAGNFMVGGALQHLNGPNESFSGTPAKLPVLGAGYVTYRFDLNAEDNMDADEKSYVIPSVVFYKQSAAQSMQAGIEYKHQSVSAGVWYRSGGASGPSAVMVSFVFDIFVNRDTGEKFRFGVSHDVPVSGINYGATSGSSEISLNYQTINPYRTDDTYKFEGATHCYEFY